MHQGKGIKNIKNSESVCLIYISICSSLISWQVQYDKIKRKALLAPNPNAPDGPRGFGGPLNSAVDRQTQDEPQNKTRPFATNLGNSVNLGNIVGGMEANGVCNPLPFLELINR